MSDKKKNGVEALDYSVIKNFDSFEIRKYDEINIVSIETNKSMGSEGFTSLFKYISGQNKEKKEIPMTAPVLNKISDEESTMAFVMPKGMHLESIPKPLREDLIVKQMDPGYYAVLKFNGFNNKRKINHKIEEFKDLLENKEYSILSDFYLARFDPPLTLPTLRKNEILVKIAYKE